MIGADIHDGDLVFFVQQPSVENGQIAAVFIDDEVTLKRVYYQQGERLVLQAENSSVPPIIIEGPDLNQVHIIGRAIAKQSAVVRSCVSIIKEKRRMHNEKESTIL